MILKKVMIATFTSLLAISGASGAYTEVECNTDPVFDQNACNQCFQGGEQSLGSNIGLLSDTWINTGTNSQILYEGEQDNPRMINLNGAIWSQDPDSDNFWELTESMEAIYSEDEGGYVLEGGDSVDWLQSRLGYAYNLEENLAAKGENVGLLVYPIVTHKMSKGGDIEIDGETHNECVLFTSGDVKVTVTPPEKPKELPQTGPESILLLFLAMILAFGVIKLTKRA